jgi:dihydrofolate reductase
MRRLILEEWLSLDGYAVDQEGTLDFFPATEVDQFSDRDQLEFLESVDTILLGRRTYELFVDFWPTATTDTEIIADRLTELPKLVFSNTLSEAPWREWPPARVVRGDAVTEIERLKAQDGKHMVLWGSLYLAQTLITADLIDEYHVQLSPTLVGGGRPTVPWPSRLCEVEAGERADLRHGRGVPPLRAATLSPDRLGLHDQRPGEPLQHVCISRARALQPQS